MNVLQEEYKYLLGTETVANTTSAAESEAWYVGRYLNHTLFYTNASGTATITIEASPDGVLWVTLDTFSDAEGVVQYNGLLPYIRVSRNATTNAVKVAWAARDYFAST